MLWLVAGGAGFPLSLLRGEEAMRTAHVLDHLIPTHWRRQGLIHVHHPLPRRRPRVLFARMAAKGGKDLAALVMLALLMGALAVTGVFIAREVGRGMVIADLCGGDCTSSAVERAPGS